MGKLYISIYTEKDEELEGGDIWGQVPMLEEVSDEDCDYTKCVYRNPNTLKRYEWNCNHDYNGNLFSLIRLKRVAL